MNVQHQMDKKPVRDNRLAMCSWDLAFVEVSVCAQHIWELMVHLLCAMASEKHTKGVFYESA